MRRLVGLTLKVGREPVLFAKRRYSRVIVRDRLQVTRILADRRRVLAHDVGRQALAHVRSLDARTH